MRIAVIGATGTAGSRTVARLSDRDVDVVEVSRSHGADLVTGEGLTDALREVDVVVDASNPSPPDDTMSLHEALTTATANLVRACSSQGVARLVFLSISGIEKPLFDAVPYYVGKRGQEEALRTSPLRTTVLKTTQWHEFATNPAAVTFDDDEVVVQDWLIQPVAVGTVADVLVELAVSGAPESVRTIAGPEVIRLPELTSRLLTHLGDPRPVRSVAPAVPALAEGALLAPANATVLGPTVDGWLETVDRSA